MAIEMAIQKKNASIAEARNSLARLVHEAESGHAVEITRRGKPVAVLLSLAEYRRLIGKGGSLWEAIVAFREAHQLESAGIDPDEVFSVDRRDDRDREPAL